MLLYFYMLQWFSLLQGIFTKGRLQALLNFCFLKQEEKKEMNKLLGEAVNLCENDFYFPRGKRREKFIIGAGSSFI